MERIENESWIRRKKRASNNKKGARNKRNNRLSSGLLARADLCTLTTIELGFQDGTQATGRTTERKREPQFRLLHPKQSLPRNQIRAKFRFPPKKAPTSATIGPVSSSPIVSKYPKNKAVEVAAILVVVVEMQRYRLHIQTYRYVGQYPSMYGGTGLHPLE